MGWKGTIRSIGAAARAAERDAKRRQRELESQQKAYEKMKELEQAEYEVEVYQNQIEVLQSIHKECSAPIDWKKIASSQEPQKPVNLNECENEARAAAANYQPGFTDRILKREEKTRLRLEENIANAIEKDLAEYKNRLSCWETERSDWEESVILAQSLLDGDKDAKIETIKFLDPFSEISTLGSNISVSIGEKGTVEVTIHIHGVSIVPNEVKSLLKSGKLSVKKMPKGQFNELYQDYVCSSVLRVANELLSILADEFVIVTAIDEMLNTKTGHLEKAPILSACVSRNTLRSLNMDRVDPSDSMSNFVHNMSFKKSKGFEVVSRVEQYHD